MHELGLIAIVLVSVAMHIGKGEPFALNIVLAFFCCKFTKISSKNSLRMPIQAKNTPAKFCSQYGALLLQLMCFRTEPSLK